MMTSIVTKTGDEGKTSLFGGSRVSKDSPRLHAYGTVDELNAMLGLCIAEKGVPGDIREHLKRLQHLLFRVGGDLATPLSLRAKEERISPDHVAILEAWISSIEVTLPPQMQFLLPGGSKASAQLHVARTICRRAERWVVALEKMEEVNPEVRILLNRMSDYLFLAARKANIESKTPEAEVEY